MRMRPWVHYIPVDYHFTNLTKSMEWALANEAEVKAIIQRMHEYADKYNTAEFAVVYTAELLKQYAKLLDYKVERRPEQVAAEDVDRGIGLSQVQLGRGRVGGLDDSDEIALLVSDDSAVRADVVRDERQHRCRNVRGPVGVE